MAGGEASSVAVTADPATSMAPQEISLSVRRGPASGAYRNTRRRLVPFTAKVVGIMFCVYGIMFLGGLVGAHPSDSTRTWSLTMLGPHNRVDSKGVEYQRA